MLSLLLVGLAAVASSTDAIGQALQSSMIWAPNAPVETQSYVVFRKTFSLDEAAKSGRLKIFADSRYILWVNGTYVERGPCRFDPQEPSYDSLDITPMLRKGKNAVAVLVHHYHDGLAENDPTPLNGRTMRHEPGLTVLAEITGEKGATVELKTDSSWVFCDKTRFQPSPVSWGWIPDVIDARLDSGDWTSPDFDNDGWKSAEAVNGSLWGPLSPRPISRLREERIVPETLLRSPKSSEPSPLSSALPLRLETGEEILVDVGRSVLAYVLIDLEAAAGTEINVNYSHGLVNGVMDEAYGPSKYTAKDGGQVYMGGDACGFKFMRITAISGPVTLHEISVVNRVYPFNKAGAFKCNDESLNELWTRSTWTVGLCSDDGYVDCTARERTEWLGDAAIIEYPLTRVAFVDAGAQKWGNSALAANMLNHIALSQQPDGRLKAHHPSNRWDIHGYIEDYSCLWVRMLRSYYDNTLDKDFIGKQWGALEKQLKWFAEHKTEKGLVKAREFVFADNPTAYKVCEGVTLNAIYAAALRDASYMAGVLGKDAERDSYSDEADLVARRINEVLWNDEAGTYDAAVMDGAKLPPSAHAAMLALYGGVVPEDRRDCVMKWLVKHIDKVGTPFSAHYLLDVLYRTAKPDLDMVALNFIRERWKPTLARKDLDSVFEGFNGSSLCHNAGASAGFYLSAFVLGVRREGPLSERTILIDPHPGDLHEASGVVVTEFGNVYLDWTNSDGAMKLNVDLTPTASGVMRFPVNVKDSLRIEGKKTDEPQPGVRVNEEGGQVIFRLDGRKTVEWNKKP
jgi:hypothetical protein